MSKSNNRRKISLRKRLWAKQGGRCFYCRRRVVCREGATDGVNPPNLATLDHVVPRSQGGPRVGNSVVACLKCNAERGDAPAAAFLIAKVVMANVCAPTTTTTPPIEGSKK